MDVEAQGYRIGTDGLTVPRRVDNGFTLAEMLACRPKPKGRRQVRSGFTLVEMLVVIAIISTLAALLLPSLGRVMERTRTTACQSNLRQIGTTILFLAQDGVPVLGQGYFPGESGWDMVDGQQWGYTWFGLVGNELGLVHLRPPDHALDLNSTKPRLFLCPSADRKIAGWTKENLSYGYNIRLGPTINPSSVQHFRSERVGGPYNPAKTGVLTDSNQDGLFDSWVQSRYIFQPGARHQNGGNVFFADGHAQWRLYEDLVGHGNPFE